MKENDNSEESIEFISQFLGVQRVLHAYILAQVPSLSEADDILQEANLVLWSKRDEFTIESGIRPLAFRVAHFQVLAHRKRKQRDPLVYNDGVLQLLAEEAGQRADLFDQKREALVYCLKKLRDRDQELLHDRYARGLRGRKLAQRLDRTVDSILHSLHRIRGALRKCVERNLAMEERI